MDVTEPPFPITFPACGHLGAGVSEEPLRKVVVKQAAEAVLVEVAEVQPVNGQEREK